MSHKIFSLFGTGFLCVALVGCVATTPRAKGIYAEDDAY